MVRGVRSSCLAGPWHDSKYANREAGQIKSGLRVSVKNHNGTELNYGVRLLKVKKEVKEINIRTEKNKLRPAWALYEGEILRSITYNKSEVERFLRAVK